MANPVQEEVFVEEQKGRRILKVVVLLFALGLAMAWGMVVGGGLVYAWTHFFEDRNDHARAEVITLDLPAEEWWRRDVELGALIVEVVPGSPAEQAGLEAGDRIVAVDGARVGFDRDLAEVLAEYTPGERVVLLVERTGVDSLEMRVRLAEHPEIRGRAYLGVQYAPTFSWRPEIQIVPFDDSGERFHFDAPEGEFWFHAIPDSEESH
jgi:membrane-associated protease RseP (regulator of RpoE activity)